MNGNHFFAPLDGPPPKHFDCERLRLRALKATDAKLLFDLYASDPDNCRYMSFKSTGKLEDTELFVTNSVRFASGQDSPVKHLVWILERRSDAAALGSVGIGPLNAFTLCGGYILNKNYWGHGYATEAWRCIVNWAKSLPGVFRIEAWHDLENQASGKVMQKAGMTFEGVLRRHTLLPNISDEPRDSAVYAWARD